MGKQVKTKKCLICGASTKNKYCSRSCYYRARRLGYYKPYWEGKHRSKETSSKVSNILKKKYKDGDLVVWCKGKHLTKDHRKKLSVAKLGVYMGRDHPNWRGGRKTDERGYVRVWVDKRRWRYEHRLVMEKHLGRKLNKSEIVHHIDRNKSNNNLDNLMLFPNSGAHIKYHIHVLGDKVKNQYNS